MKQVTQVTSPPTGIRSPFRDRKFLLLTVGNSLMYLDNTVLVVMLPIWIVRHDDTVPLGLMPVLLAINTVLTVILQIPISSLKMDFVTAKRLQWSALAAFSLGCVLFIMAGLSTRNVSMTLLIAAVALFAVGESSQVAAAWFLSDAKAPLDSYARYISVFTMGSTAQNIFGPPLLIGLLLPLETAGWIILSGLFAAGTIIMRAGARPTSHWPTSANVK